MTKLKDPLVPPDARTVLPGREVTYHEAPAKAAHHVASMKAAARRAEKKDLRMVASRCTQIADAVVPEYRGGKRSYSCTSVIAKRWQAAWEGACHALGGRPDDYRTEEKKA